MSMLKNALLWFIGLFQSKDKPFKSVVVDDMPDTYKKSIIYLVGEGSSWYANMLCPCGCSEVIRLCLLDDVNPSWKLIHHASDGTVSLQPSIWKTSGCKLIFS